MRTMDRRTVLRLGLSSALGLAAFPSLASAQSDSATPTIDDWPNANPIGPTWVITTGEAALRGEPDLSNNRFGFARAGTPLQLLGTDGDWSYVFNPHTQGTAYVYSNLLTPGPPPSPWVTRPAPQLVDQARDTVVLTQDSVLA